MGNLCSTSSDRDPFAQPGRTLDSTPAAARTSAPPKGGGQQVGGPPRTLGGGGYGTNNGQSDEARLEARRAAAEAAEARARTSKPSGKLAADLQKQKAQTRKDTLEQVSREERRVRDSDQGAEARAFN